MGASEKVAATFHPFPPGNLKAFQDQVNRLWASPGIQAALAAWEAYRQRQALMPHGLAQAVSEWDRALDDAEEHYQDRLEAFRADWAIWGRSALSWRMWASLTPGLTYDDVMATGRSILRSRVACDWTPRETALVATALMEGWQERVSRYDLTGPK